MLYYLSFLSVERRSYHHTVKKSLNDFPQLNGIILKYPVPIKSRLYICLTLCMYPCLP